MAPTLRRRQEPVVISVSSDEDGEEEGIETEGEDGESSDEESCSSVYDINDEDEEDEEDTEDEEESGDEDEGESGDEDEEAEGSPDRRASTEEEVYDKISNLLQRGKQLGKLKLEECKLYLRRYNLRISGSKAVCIQRIHEHWRIKDGNAENLYPASSFTINCRGDVCKGDVILFKQRVFEKFDIVTRGANMIGKRTVAGRVVKESYGAAKQQHTFTVEVLWSKGVRRLPTLSLLLVKGRNLYRIKTFRQPWENEAERSIVLSEKHGRGAAARHVRAIAKARFGNKGPKQKSSSSLVPINKQTHACKKRSSRVSSVKQTVKRTVKRTNKAPKKHMDHDNNALNEQPKCRIVDPSAAPEYPLRPILPPPEYPPSQTLPPVSYPEEHPIGDHQFNQARHRHVQGLHGISRVGNLHDKVPNVGPYSHSHQCPQGIYDRTLSTRNNNSCWPSSDQFVPPAGSWGIRFSGTPFADNRLQQFHFMHSSTADFQASFTSNHRSARTKQVVACPTQGCQNLADHGCIVSLCYLCCKQIRRQCYRHQI